MFEPSSNITKILLLEQAWRSYGYGTAIHHHVPILESTVYIESLLVQIAVRNHYISDCLSITFKDVDYINDIRNSGVIK